MFWFSVFSAFTMHYSLIYVWKDSNEWTNLEHLTIYYLYYKLGYYICDNTSEYLSNIRSEKQKLEEPGATKENPIDLTMSPSTPTTATPSTPTTATSSTTQPTTSSTTQPTTPSTTQPTTPSTPKKPKIKHITAICQTDELVEEVEI